MKRLVLLLTVLAIAIPTLSFGLTAKEIIKKVDRNEVYTTQKFEAVMTIERGTRKKLVKNFEGYGRKQGNVSFMEFTNPEDKGVKYLKKENEMWIYFPDADDVMKISGHMLRQGMMGSDISYEDMLENDELDEKYTSSLLAETNIDGHSCYTINLKAKVDNVTYDREVLYVDKSKFTPRRIEMYARGGRLLKVMELKNIKNYGSRKVATKIVIKDMRKRNSETTIEFKSISFDISVPSRVFTRQYLK